MLVPYSIACCEWKVPWFITSASIDILFHFTLAVLKQPFSFNIARCHYLLSSETLADDLGVLVNHQVFVSGIISSGSQGTASNYK